MKSMDKKERFLMISILIGIFLLPIIFWQKLPSALIIHWDVQGNPHGEVAKTFALIMIPFLALLFYLLFHVIVQRNSFPKKHTKNHKWYASFLLVFLVFFFLLELIGFLANLSFLPCCRALFWLVGGFFLALSWIFPQIPQNHFVGIRTPWTLRKKTVWKTIHQEARPLFFLLGMLSFIIPFGLPLLLWLGIFLLILFYLVMRSYFLYQKGKINHNNP